jgi:proline racemase
MAYAIVDVDSLGIAVEPGQGKRLQEAAVRITAAAREALHFQHPELPAIVGIEGAVLYSPPRIGRVNHRQTTCLSTGQMSLAQRRAD